MGKTQKYRITDLIDIPRIIQLLETFFAVTNVATAILDLDGKIILQVGWQNVCTMFHRVNPETVKNCLKSDTILSGKLAAGSQYNVYKCLNGLVDVAVPIMMNGEHIGNFFTGQLFLGEPDLDFFRNQARKYGFDEETYLKDISKVSVYSDEEIKKIMHFLLNITELLCEMGIKRIQQQEISEAMKNSEERFRLAFDNIPDVVVMYDKDLKVQYMNNAIIEAAGYKPSDFIGKRGDEVLPLEIHQIYYSQIKKVFKTKQIEILDATLKLPNRGTRHVRITCVPVMDKNEDVREVLGISHDYTELKGIETKLRVYQEHLEELVKKRTQELEEKNKELEQYNKLFIGREFRIKELRDKIKELEKTLEQLK